MNDIPDLPTVPYDLDDDMLASTREDQVPRVRVYQPPELAVVIGRGGKQELELDRDAITADGVKLYKRPGGGCAVVLDAGNLVVSVALGLPGISHIKTTFEKVGDWVIAGLAECGVPGVEQRGVSDLAIGEKKIGGSCVYRTRGLFYYSTTLLVDPDFDLVERYLPHPPREPDYRAGRDHRAFMGSLRGMGPNADPSTFRDRLEAELNRRLPLLAAATALPDPGSQAQS
jgi:lipoate-protein ligase A